MRITTNQAARPARQPASSWFRESNLGDMAKVVQTAGDDEEEDEEAESQLNVGDIVAMAMQGCSKIVVRISPSLRAFTLGSLSNNTKVESLPLGFTVSMQNE